MLRRRASFGASIRSPGGRATEWSAPISVGLTGSSPNCMNMRSRCTTAGSKKAADLLASSENAVRFALIDKTGHALDGNKAFFFGADPGDVGAMLAQPLAAAASSVAMRDAPAPARRS